CGAGTRDDEFYRGNVLAYHFQAVQERCAYGNRSAVLVIVEYRNTAALTQLALDDETFGRLDIFEIDAAERRFEARDDIYQLFRVTFVDLDIEDVDAGEFLEENRLAFHYRLGGERTDI